MEARKTPFRLVAGCGWQLGVSGRFSRTSSVQSKQPFLPEDSNWETTISSSQEIKISRREDRRFSVGGESGGGVVVRAVEVERKEETVTVVGEDVNRKEETKEERVGEDVKSIEEREKVEKGREGEQEQIRKEPEEETTTKGEEREEEKEKGRETGKGENEQGKVEGKE